MDEEIAAISDALPTIASEIEAEIVRVAGKPVPWLMLAWLDGEATFISSCVDPAEVIAAMQGIIRRLESGGGQHRPDGTMH